MKPVLMCLVGICLICMGQYCNGMVMRNNRGRMPVLAHHPRLVRRTALSQLHRVATSSTKMLFLADIIPVPLGRFLIGYERVSVGDLCMVIGAVVSVFYLTTLDPNL